MVNITLLAMENTNKIKLLSKNLSRTALSRSFWRLSHGAWRRQEKLLKLSFLLSRCPLPPPFVPKSAIVIFNINLPQLSVFWCFSKSRFISLSHLILSEVMEHLIHPAQHLLLARAGACLGIQASGAAQNTQVLFLHFCLKNITMIVQCRHGIGILRSIQADTSYICANFKSCKLLEN